MNEVNSMLEEQIKDILTTMNYFDAHSEEYKKMVENLETLETLKLKEDELEGKFQADFEKTNSDKSDKIERRINKGIDVVLQVFSIVAPLMLYSKLMLEGYEYEETGNLTSKTFGECRSLFARKIF